MTQKFGDREFFEEGLRRRLATEFPEYARLHREVGKMVARYIPKDGGRAIEIGPGNGAMMESLLHLGYNIIGIEPNPYEREYFAVRNPEFADKMVALRAEDYDYEQPFDIAVSIEVFEHLTDVAIDSILSRLKAKWFLFSSTNNPTTPEFDEQWGHINMKSMGDWGELFKRYGYLPYTYPGFPTEWTILFRKEDSAK